MTGIKDTGLHFIVARLSDDNWHYLAGPSTLESLNRVLTDWRERHPTARILSAIEPSGEGVGAGAQCCMCGKKGLSTVEGDGGPECQLTDGRWTCSHECWERAVDPHPEAEPVAWNGLDQSWQTLLERDDRTSPEDYPDHALITKDELSDIVASATSDVFALYAQPLSGMEGAEQRTMETACRILMTKIYNRGHSGLDLDCLLCQAYIAADRLLAFETGCAPSEEVRSWNRRLSTPVSAASPEGEDAVPEGFVLVPREPTGEMWLAGRKMFDAEAEKFRTADRYEQASAIADRAPEHIYRSMLAASPRAVEQGGEKR